MVEYQTCDWLTKGGLSGPLFFAIKKEMTFSRHDHGEL